MYLKSRGDLNCEEYSVPHILRGPGSWGAGGRGDGVTSPRSVILSDLFLGLHAAEMRAKCLLSSVNIMASTV